MQPPSAMAPLHRFTNKKKEADQNAPPHKIAHREALLSSKRARWTTLGLTVTWTFLFSPLSSFGSVWTHLISTPRNPSFKTSPFRSTSYYRLVKSDKEIGRVEGVYVGAGPRVTLSPEKTTRGVIGRDQPCASADLHYSHLSEDRMSTVTAAFPEHAKTKARQPGLKVVYHKPEP